MHRVELILHGVGNVGRLLLDLLDRQRALLARRHALDLVVVGAVDSGGALWRPAGIPPTELIAAKREGGSVAALDGGEPGANVLALLDRAGSPVTLLEATLVELADGGIGLRAMREALARGFPVVSANKGPLVVAFQELDALAARHGAGLMYSATVCGGLPVVNVGRYDLAHATVHAIEGILNSTTHHLLTEMGRGRPFDVALREAQEIGIAESDPTLDVSGWDAANKLIILSNSMLRYPAGPADVSVTGIEAVTPEALRAAADAGRAIKLIASARRGPDGAYTLEVAPRELPLSNPLARLTGHSMGLRIESDINGVIFLSIAERDPTPTAAAMLRDIVLLARGARAW